MKNGGPVGKYVDIKAYQEEAAKKSDFERTELVKDKTGVELKGVMGINPVNGKEIPIFISDYVLVSYGTGAIMAVPGHDTRDYDFAKKFNLPIIEVVSGGNVEEAAFTDCETGIMVNSGMLNGMSVEEAKKIHYCMAGKRRKRSYQSQLQNCVTGYFPDSVIGENPFLLSIVSIADMFRCRKMNFL